MTQQPLGRAINRISGAHRLLLVVALTGAACGPRLGPQAPAQPRATPILTAAGPRAILPDGFGVQLELALTPEETERGLMFRPSLPANRGMIFVFREVGELSFWMKNTWIPLDIVFLDSRGTVVHIEAAAQPCAAEPCPRYLSGAPAKAVIELVAGTAHDHALVDGSRVRFVSVPGYPLGN